MAVLNIKTTEAPGLVGVAPEIIYIETDDTYAEVTTTGYLTQYQNRGYTFSNQQMALVYTSDEGPVWVKVVITYSGATVLNTVVSLVQVSSPGDVTLPTIANNIIASTDTAGTLGNIAATAINRGSLQAGLSGTAGSLISYPSTASRGSLALTAVANTGNTATVISNAAMGQATTVTIPDPGAASANFLLSTSGSAQTIAGGLTISSGNLGVTLGNITATAGNITASAGNVIAGASGALGLVRSFPSVAASGYLEMAATTNTSGNFHTTIATAAAIAQSQVISIPDVGAATGQFNVVTGALVSGNLMEAAGTAGKLADSGIAASGVQLKSQVKAVRTGNVGGAGTLITVTDASVVSTSVIVANIVSSSNAVQIQTVTPGTGDFAVVFSADPGANCVLNYVLYIAQQ